MVSDNPLPELWQFELSLYPEKVRWAMEYKGILYKPHYVLPGPHVLSLFRRFGQKSTPVLVDGCLRLKDSTEILRYLENHYPGRPLLPEDEDGRKKAWAVEALFDNWGSHVRRGFFDAMLHYPDYSADRFSSFASPLVRDLYRRVFPGVSKVMQMDMGIRPMKVRESYIHVQDALNFVKEHTRETGYIVGDHFTLADLSAAVGLFAVCLPPEYPVDFPRPLPKEIQAWLNRWERHPGTKWVRRMYNRYRLPGALGD